MAFLLIAYLALATIVPRPPPSPPPRPALAMLGFAPVPLDPGDPARRRLGALVYRGGWEIVGDSPRFGGISALHVEGGEAIALSDAGILIRFALPTGRGRAPVRLVPLPDGPGPATRKSNRDTESMLVRGPWLWAGFERHNMIWRYRRSDLAATARAAPEPMRGWRSNGGPEAMARLADGRFLVLAEGANDGRPTSAAVLFDGDPADPGTRASPLRYRRVPGYRVTDAGVLPDGRLILLNRRFAWLEGFSAVVTVAGTGGLGEGATIEGRALAVLRPPASVDNMEALSVTVERGRTIVWLASDDNFFPLQRTLLLKFELIE
ncbi:MAG TPA: esterase-like activity of phytase family protein [Allosphingosinicella sp.]|nr:esterase-like activity of phytase family protein [Allosphingosinicella sp.]